MMFSPLLDPYQVIEYGKLVPLSGFLSTHIGGEKKGGKEWH